MPSNFDKLHGAIEMVRQASCLSKIRSYGSLLDCEEAIVELYWRLPDHGEGLHGYYCVFCNNFHIGRPPAASTIELLQVEHLISFDFSRCDRSSKTVNRSMAKPRARDECILLAVLMGDEVAHA